MGCVGSFKPSSLPVRTVPEDHSFEEDTLRRLDRVRARVCSSHEAFVDAVATAGRVTASSWDDQTAATDRSAVVDRFESVLRETGTLSAAPAVLESAVDAAGGSLQAAPVASPPYIVVTGEGVVLRARTDVGRVVVTVAPFSVERDPVRYVHRDVDDVSALVEVEINR